MDMADKTSSFIEQCRARAIKARHEELGLPVSLAQTYELLAAAEGHRTWAAMRASGEASTMADAPDEAYKLKAAESGTRIATLKVTRRISLDAQAAGSLHRDALIGAAHAELSFALFDGEEYPPMLFRGCRSGPLWTMLSNTLPAP